MRIGLLSSILLWFASAGLVMAQAGEPSCASCGTTDTGTAFSPHVDQISDNAFGPEACCPSSCGWIDLEYMYWWLRGSPLPPIITTSNPTTPTFVTSSGILGFPNTHTVYGDERVGLKDINGGRVSGGWWFDPGHTFGLEANYFGLETNHTNFFVSSDLGGNPVLTRPVRTSQETAFFISFPDQFAGAANIGYVASFFGAEANAIFSPCSCYFKYPDFLFGFRYLDLAEDFGVGQVSRLLPAGRSAFNTQIVQAPDVIAVSDQFTSHNQFMGGQIGVRKVLERGMFFVSLSAKVAAGENHETATIHGQSNLGTGTALVTVPGGLLALASNIGHYEHDTFSLVPEGDVTLGFRITKYLNLKLGYQSLYWTHVIRPGDEIDRIINPRLLPTAVQYGQFAAPAGPATPTFGFKQRDFWAHAVHVGFEFEY